MILPVYLVCNLQQLCLIDRRIFILAWKASCFRASFWQAFSHLYETFLIVSRSIRSHRINILNNTWHHPNQTALSKRLISGKCWATFKQVDKLYRQVQLQWNFISHTAWNVCIGEIFRRQSTNFCMHFCAYYMQLCSSTCDTESRLPKFYVTVKVTSQIIRLSIYNNQAPSWR